VTAPAEQATKKKQAPDADMDSRFRPGSRLADKHSYSRVFEKADRSRDKMFTVLYRPNGTEKPRLGLAIGKKNCRLASGRNRLKRLVRESFRHYQGDLPGLDIVVLNQPAAASAKNNAIFGSLEVHWQRCASQRSDEAGKT
jgi:ribonuclease P protein component